MDESKLIKMAEGVVRIEEAVKGYSHRLDNTDRRMERIETIVDKSSGSFVRIEGSLGRLDEWKDSVDEWRTSVDESITGMKDDIQVCKQGFLGHIDKTTMLKIILALFGVLVAGGAGSEALSKLIEFLLKIGG